MYQKQIAVNKSSISKSVIAPTAYLADAVAAVQNERKPVYADINSKVDANKRYKDLNP